MRVRGSLGEMELYCLRELNTLYIKYTTALSLKESEVQCQKRASDIMVYVKVSPCEEGRIDTVTEPHALGDI